MTMIEKLRGLYPSGIVQGDAQAIVGQFGLTICWNFIKDDGSYCKEQKRYKEDEKIYISEIVDNGIKLAGVFPEAIISTEHFKGFTYKKRA